MTRGEYQAGQLYQTGARGNVPSYPYYQGTIGKGNTQQTWYKPHGPIDTKNVTAREFQGNIYEQAKGGNGRAGFYQPHSKGYYEGNIKYKPMHHHKPFQGNINNAVQPERRYVPKYVKQPRPRERFLKEPVKKDPKPPVRATPVVPTVPRYVPEVRGQIIREKEVIGPPRTPPSILPDQPKELFVPPVIVAPPPEPQKSPTPTPSYHPPATPPDQNPFRRSPTAFARHTPFDLYLPVRSPRPDSRAYIYNRTTDRPEPIFPTLVNADRPVSRGMFSKTHPSTPVKFPSILPYRRMSYSPSEPYQRPTGKSLPPYTAVGSILRFTNMDNYYYYY